MSEEIKESKCMAQYASEAEGKDEGTPMPEHFQKQIDIMVEALQALFCPTAVAGIAATMRPLCEELFARDDWKAHVLEQGGTKAAIHGLQGMKVMYLVCQGLLAAEANAKVLGGFAEIIKKMSTEAAEAQMDKVLNDAANESGVVH